MPTFWGGLRQKVVKCPVPVHAAGLLLALVLASPLHAEPGSGTLEQRTRFLEAKKALEQGDARKFLQTASTLQDYPLYPYLVYWHLRRHLGEQDETTIQAFLDTNSDTPLASRLQRAWLRRLARDGRWQQYLSFYNGSRRADLRCYAHLAELKTGSVEAAWKGAEALWMVGHSQSSSSACDPLFDAWEQAGGIDKGMRWDRIKLAMANGEGELAAYLAKSLDETAQQRVALWRRVENQPELIGEEQALGQDDEINRLIIMQGMHRLARRDPANAIAKWSKIANWYRFSDEQRRQLANTIAMNFAYDGDARALNWFAKLPDQRISESSAGWAVRAALRDSDWKSVLEWIGKVPAEKRYTEQWQYWQARAYEGLGEQGLAEPIYRRVSASRSYYGFLAADRSDNPYNLEHEPLQVNAESLAQLKKMPALIRARELYHLTMTRDARYEWDYAVSRMSREERLVAGKLADEWQWYDRALLTLAKAQHFDDLNIRFPLAYHEEVTREAEKRNLDPAWIYAVARQESAFIEDVRSSAGALGLMQLMPATGRSIARQLKTSVNNKILLQPETNIRFGSYYLQQVLNRFNNPVMATAAYNAGPHRIERWKPKEGTIDADIWVDNIPFNETRKYVRRVMAYSVFYDQRLNRPIKRLKERMPAVGDVKEDERCDDCETKEGEKG
jgi:soluble lytic murein transglycosylase